MSATLRSKKERTLTWERDTENENRTSDDEDQGWNPAHRADIVFVDSDIAGTTIRLRLQILFGDLTTALLLSVARRGFILVLVTGKLPVRQGEVKARDVATSGPELLKRTLFGDCAVLIESDDVVTVSKTLGCDGGDR